MLVKFEIYNDGEYWCARGIGADIMTQGRTMDECMENIKEAVELHFEDLLNTGENIQILSMAESEVRSIAKASGS